MVLGAFLNLTTTLSLSCIYNPNAAECQNESMYETAKNCHPKIVLKIIAHRSPTLIVASFSAGDFTPPPLIVHGASPQTLLVHDIAILPCLTNAGDAANVSWFRDGERIAADHRVSQATSGSLRISDLK